MKISKRVCLITPGHLSTNPRLVKEARALEEAGYTVQIVHGYYMQWGAEQDQSIASDDWNVIRVPFGRNLAPKMQHVRQRLIQALSLQAYRLGLRIPRLACYAQAPISRDLIIATCLAPPADLYVGHYPPGLAAAAIAAALHRAPHAFDAEDFHVGDLPNTAKSRLPNLVIQSVEREYLKNCSYISAASPLIAQAYSRAYRVPEPTPLLNVFPKTNGPSSPSCSGTAEPSPSVYWFSQTIGPGRGLETVCHAIALAKSKPHLYLRGTPAIGYDSQLKKLVGVLNIEDRLHFLEASPPDSMESLGTAYDIGIAAELDDTANHSFALANKIFSYFTSGIPCIATNILSHVHFENENPGSLIIYQKNDPKDLALKMDSLLLSPENLTAARFKAWTLGQTLLSWETTKTQYLELVEAAISLRRSTK